jgi:hypothetical protein
VGSHIFTAEIKEDCQLAAREKEKASKNKMPYSKNKFK